MEEKKLSTKDRITDVALDLFAEKGFSAVSVHDIAEAVGIKAPSLYKHFSGKEEIFKSAVTKASTLSTSFIEDLPLPSTADNKGKNALDAQTMTEKCMVDIVTAFFNYFITDPAVSRLRKVMTLEQYHNKEISDLYNQIYFDGIRKYISLLFRAMRPNLCQDTSYCDVLSLKLYGPIYSLLLLYDRSPERAADIQKLLNLHIKLFVKDFNNLPLK